MKLKSCNGKTRGINRALTPEITVHFKGNGQEAIRETSSNPLECILVDKNAIRIGIPSIASLDVAVKELFTERGEEETSTTHPANLHLLLSSSAIIYN